VFGSSRRDHDFRNPLTVESGELDEKGFDVADDGPGIPDHERERVFESGYSQGETGTGFELSIVQEMVATHDWEITITESEGGGARFDSTGLEKKTDVNSLE
jgi:signal transduction histidine kinase